MSNTVKKYLKGFRSFKIFPILTNTETEYKVGEGTLIPFAQALTKDIQSSENIIYADDDVYDKENNVDGENFTLTLTQLTDELRASLEGGTYDATTKEYTFATINEAPEFACTYRGLLSNGNYKMYRQYRAKVSKIKIDLNTKGNNNTPSVVIEGMFMARACDSDLVTTKESTSSADLTWLDTIPEVKPSTNASETPTVLDGE